MGDCDDVFASMFTIYMLCCCVNAVGGFVPAFASGGSVVARFFPLGA